MYTEKDLKNQYKCTNAIVVRYLHRTYLISLTLYNFYILFKYANHGKRGRYKDKRRKKNNI